MPQNKFEFVITVERVPANGGDPAGFVATNDELGLVVEADSLDEIAEKVRAVAPGLFEANILSGTNRLDAKVVPPAYVIQHLLDGIHGGNLLS